MLVSVLTATDLLVRSVSALSLSDVAPVLTIDLDEDGVLLTYATEWQEIREHVPLGHPCLTCSLREAVIPFLDSKEPSRVILALPASVDAASVIPTFQDEVDQRGWIVTSAVTVCEVSQASEELLHHLPVRDRGLALFPEDDRCIGEVAAMNLGYSDVIVALGEDEQGHALVEHLRPHETLLLDSLSELGTEILFSGVHDVDAAIARIHPASTAAWGGPTNEGVWTLDLHSERPFHPERFLDAMSALCQDGLCVRGCFWLPSRPHSVGALNAHGDSITVGEAGEWPDEPFTHLIVTGTGNQTKQVEQVFAAALVGNAEYEQMLAWVGVDDQLGYLFGDD